MSLTLAIDASLMHCSVALGNADGILYSESIVSEDQTRDLAPIVNKMIVDKRDEISKILVTVGPGSFTGIRSSIAFAKGLAKGISAELFGISCFSAITKSITNNEYNFLVILESKCKKKYYQLLNKKNMPIEKASVAEITEIVKLYGSNLVLVSNIKEAIESDIVCKNKYFIEKIEPSIILNIEHSFYLDCAPIYLLPSYF